MEQTGRIPQVVANYDHKADSRDGLFSQRPRRGILGSCTTRSQHPVGRYPLCISPKKYSVSPLGSRTQKLRCPHLCVVNCCWIGRPLSITCQYIHSTSSTSITMKAPCGGRSSKKCDASPLSGRFKTSISPEAAPKSVPWSSELRSQSSMSGSLKPSRYKATVYSYSAVKYENLNWPLLSAPPPSGGVSVSKYPTVLLPKPFKRNCFIHPTS